MSNYIFLDIDGVLNYTGLKTRAPYECMGIAQRPLNILKEIVEQTNGKLVLISDWRLSFLPNDHMPKMADYITKRLQSVGLSFELASQNHSYEIRAEEIKKWIESHSATGYIILDDDDNRYYHNNAIKPHWLHIDYRKGLREEDIQKAIAKMKEPIEPIHL